MSNYSNLKSSRGRPRVLDEAKRREVCALISVGVTVSDAARYVGCAVSTIRREALRNEEFSAALRRAALGAELSPLHDIRSAAKKYWRAGAWLLERLNPRAFAKRNPAMLTLEQVQGIMDNVGKIIHEEIPHEKWQQRVFSRLTQLGEHMIREAWLAHRDPCPPARRARKSTRSATKIPSPAESPHAPDSCDEQ
jgi:hypothetical protein